jgi:prolyl oligopeptidase
MVRCELDPNGLANVPEFGTVKTKEGFQSLYAMSSYHQAKPADYPAVMLVHGVNDTRVSVWQTTKYANRIMHNSKSGKPVLMRLDYQLGHGGGASRLQQQEQTADIWSFMFWQMGLPNFQPN